MSVVLISPYLYLTPSEAVVHEKLLPGSQVRERASSDDSPFVRSAQLHFLNWLGLVRVTMRKTISGLASAPTGRYSAFFEQ